MHSTSASQSKLTRRTATLSVVLAVVVATAGFAGGAPEANSGTGGEGMGAGEMVTLEVGYMPILPVAQAMIIDGLGWAEAEGIRLEMQRFSSGPAMVQATAAGNLDVMNFGIGPAMVTRSRGQDIRVVASSIVEQIAVIAGAELASVFDPAEPEALFTDFQAEFGRPARVATFPAGSVPDTVLRYWLEVTLGIGTQGLEIIPMGSDQVQQALLSGAVDGASILEPILTIVQERDPEAQVLVRADSMFPDQPGAVLAVRQELIEQQPEIVQVLVELHERATRYLQENPAEAAAIVASYIGDGLIPEETLQRAIEGPSTNYAADPRRIVDSTQRMHDFQLNQGSLASPVPLDSLFNTSFYEALGNSSN